MKKSRLSLSSDHQEQSPAGDKRYINIIIEIKLTNFEGDGFEEDGDAGCDQGRNKGHEELSRESSAGNPQTDAPDVFTAIPGDGKASPRRIIPEHVIEAVSDGKNQNGGVGYFDWKEQNRQKHTE